MLINKTSFEEIPEHLQWIIEDLIKKLKCDEIYGTDQGYLILENTKLKRIYIEVYEYDKYEGVSMEDLSEMKEYFKMEDPHIFSYPYTHEDSLLCFGRVEENEIIY